MSDPSADGPASDAAFAADARPSLRERVEAHPVPAVLAAVALAFSGGAGGAALLRDEPAPVSATPSSRPSPSPSPSPSATPPPSPSSTPSPTTVPVTAAPSPSAASDLDASCAQDAAAEAVCRFVLAVQTGGLDGLTAGERSLAAQDSDLPDGPFAVSSCDLEGDVTVLCEVQFDDPEQVAAGFRLQPTNGQLDPETGEVVVDPGEQLRYEVVEAVGLRRGATPAPVTPSPTAAPTGTLVLGGDELGVTRVGAPYREAVAAVARVLGPPVQDPAPSTECVGAGEAEVEWAAFRLAVTDDRISGWISREESLRTPSGVGVGTTVAELQRVYGDRLRLFEPSPDTGPGFTVEGVELGGDLSAAGAQGRVTSLWNGACSPP